MLLHDEVDEGDGDLTSDTEIRYTQCESTDGCTL